MCILFWSMITTIIIFYFTYMFFNRISFSNQNFLLPFNFGTNMTFHNINQPNLIKNGLCPWHFHSLDLLKFVVNINNLFRFFGKRNTFIINIYNNSFKHGMWIDINDLKWRRLQFKGMRKVFLFTGVVGFKYITINKVGEYGFFIGIRTPKKYLNLNLFGNIGEAMI